MTSMQMEARALFGRFVWRGVNIDDVTIHPSRGSRINPTLVCEQNRDAHASDANKAFHLFSNGNFPYIQLKVFHWIRVKHFTSFRNFHQN